MSNILIRLLDSVKELLILAPIVLISITVHEWAHSFAAYKLGDYTAKAEGRLSLNPLKHIDPIGAIFFLIFRFGWAKPVPVRSLYFKNPKRDMAITAIMGPLSNFIMALVATPLYAVSVYFATGTPFDFLNTFFLYFITMNIGFGIFNLIPIPPLDGSRILAMFLKPRIYNLYLMYERYAFIVFIALMFFGVFDSIMNLLINIVASGYLYIAEFIYVFLAYVFGG